MFSAVPTFTVWREELLHALGDTLANNHTQPNLALMLLIQGIQGALSNQHFQQMNPNNRKKVFGMLVNSQKTSAGNICSKDASANDGPKFKEDTS